MNEKLRSAVYGLAVGDALGVPYEFKERDSFKCEGMTGYGTWNQPAGTWSDDTSLVLATCDSIKTLKRINPYDIMGNFALWLYRGEYTPHGKVFDVGNTTKAAINRFYVRGFDPLECGLTDEMSNGNGSLMRILPLAFVPGLTIKDIEDVSKLTHAHKTSVNQCINYVYICQELIKNEDFPIIFEGLERKYVKSTGYVVDTFEAALWCFANTSNYKDCVLTAVNLGGDTDTIAAIAGGLAGIKYGFEAIPAEWIEQLANKELIERCLF